MPVPNHLTQLIPERANAIKALLFVATLSVLLIAMSRLGMVLAAGTFVALPTRLLVVALMMLLAITNACVILAMAILAHEAVHNVLFRSRLANNLVGGLLSAFSLIPFCANRQFHLSHHCYSHQRGLDPECSMHERGYLFAFFAGPHLGIFLQHKKFAGNLLRGIQQRRYLQWFLLDASYFAGAVAYYAGLVIFAGVSPLYALLPTMLAFTVVFSVRAMSDHYGLPAAKSRAEHYREINEQQQLEVAGYERLLPSGWVVLTHPFVEWLWSNVNYHDVHHRYPYLSHANLKAVFEATRDEYPYTVAAGYLRNLRQLWGKPYFTEQ